SRSRREFPTVTVGGGFSNHVFDQFKQMAVLNLLDAVGKNYKSAIDLVQLAALKLVSQLFTAQRQRVPAGVLAQHQSRIGHAHRLRRHDFVGQRILEHAILVNSGLMRKRIAASDGLVWLHRDTCDFRQRLAGSVQLFGGNCGFVRITVAAYPHGHDDFFEGGIAGALANAVDGALHLARTLLHSRQRVRDRQTEVVMAMGGDRYLLDAGDFLAQRADELTIFLRHAVTDGIRNVDRGGAGGDHRFDYLAEKRDISTGGIFGRKLDVGAYRFRVYRFLA